MARSLPRLRFAFWLPLLLAIGCQRVREDRAINFSKNGDQVAFQHGGNGVFIGGQKGSPPRKIFQPADDVVATSSPLWSPTDKRLIFTTAKKADAKDNNEPRLDGDDDPAGKSHFPGATIYTCWLREAEKDGKAPEPVALFHAVCDHPGYVAANLAVRRRPDGKCINYVKQIGEHQHAVFEFDLRKKQSRRVFKHAAEAILFDWAPDNTHLVCVLGRRSEPHDTDGVWIGNPAADDWWQVPESSVLAATAGWDDALEKLRATRPTWSRQGDRFVFVTSQAKDEMQQEFIHRLCLGTPETRAVSKMAEGAKPIRDVRWSPTGDRVGYVAGQEEGPLTCIRIADKSTSILAPGVRGFVGWDDKNTSLAYVAADPIPHADSAAWVFLLTPNPRYRDALWQAPADGTSRGKRVFSGMQITFPQWSPKDAKVSLWATYNPSYRSWSSTLLDFLALAAKFDEREGKSSAIDFNLLRLRPGDPALLFDPASGKLDWLAVNPHEQIQVAHYYQLKRDFATAWQWYETANKTAKPQDVRASLFYQYCCLTRLGRDAEAKEKLAQFEREFWPKLPRAKKAANDQGPSAAEIVLALADPNSLHGTMLRDLYVAEVFLSLDAAQDGEAHFRAALKNAATETMRLSKAAVLSQFLLLRQNHKEYLELVNTTLLPLLVSQDALPTAPGENTGNPLNQLSFFMGRQMAVLPLCHPEFVKAFDREQIQNLLVRLEGLRRTAGNDKQRLWLDIMIHAAHQRLGQAAEADVAKKRIAGNPERLDGRHGKNAVALIAEVRQSGALREALRGVLHVNR